MWLLLKLWFPKKTKIFIYIFFLQKIETWSNYCGFFSKIIEESLFFVAQNLRILDIYKYNTTLNAPIRNIYFYWFLCSYIQQKKCNLERVTLLLQIFTLNLNKVDALKVHTRLGLQKSIYVLDGVMQCFANQFLLECIAYFSFNISYLAIMQQCKLNYNWSVNVCLFLHGKANHCNIRVYVLYK